MPRNPASTFSITNVSRIAKVSPGRLAYWDAIGLVKPSVMPASGRGSRRLYSFQDIAKTRIICRLRDAGLPLQRIRKSLAFVENLSIPISQVTIISDGETIYACSSDVFVDTLRDGQTVLKLIVADLLKEIEEEIAATL